MYLVPPAVLEHIDHTHGLHLVCLDSKTLMSGHFFWDDRSSLDFDSDKFSQNFYRKS